MSSSTAPGNEFTPLLRHLFMIILVVVFVLGVKTTLMRVAFLAHFNEATPGTHTEPEWVIAFFFLMGIGMTFAGPFIMGIMVATPPVRDQL